MLCYTRQISVISQLPTAHNYCNVPKSCKESAPTLVMPRNPHVYSASGHARPPVVWPFSALIRP